MKTKFKHTGKKFVARLLTLILLFTILVPQTSMAGVLHNAVLCVAPGDHIAVELKCHTGDNASVPDGVALLCHAHPVGDCTDIPLPKTEPFVHARTIPGVSSVRANVLSGLSSAAMLADIRISTLHFGLLTLKSPLYSLSVLRSVILRI
ncbi:MAG: hypothetical protein DRJ14_05855 [Acidobacteria bacterium]|nr:MAG: hypothetical protein DRJ14_05855 [Acidobacteriota bacterium]